jgi:hypothetical protein
MQQNGQAVYAKMLQKTNCSIRKKSTADAAFTP